MTHWGQLEQQLCSYLSRHIPSVAVEALPPLDGAQLLAFLGARSPGVYLELAELDASQPDTIEVSGSLIVVVRHAGGQSQSRQAENALWALVQHLISIMPLSNDNGDRFYATKGAMNRDPDLIRQGIAAFALGIRGSLSVPYQTDASTLADFLQMTAALDIRPFTPEHHPVWLEDPLLAEPNPDCRINVNLPQE